MDKSDDSQDKYIVPGLERGLLLLCEFSRKDRTLTAPELARRLKLPRSTIFRLLTTLEAMGFVTRNGNEYRLGMAVLRLGFEYLASLELTELGQPLLNRLCDEIRYPCNLVVRDGRSIVYVAKVSPSTPLSSSVNVGTRLPAHATVLGRILLQDLSLGELLLRVQLAQRAGTLRHGPGRPPAWLRPGRGVLRGEHLHRRGAGT